MRILKYRCASGDSEDWNFSEIEFKKHAFRLRIVGYRRCSAQTEPITADQPLRCTKSHY